MQVSGRLLGQIDRPVLASGAPEGHHQILKSAPLVGLHACIHQRLYSSKVAAHALLAAQELPHRRVLAGQFAESLFAAWIRQAARVENVASAVSRRIHGRSR